MTTIPSRPSFAPWRLLLRWYLDWRCRCVEADIEGLIQQRERDWYQIEVYEREAARYRVELALLD